MTKLRHDFNVYLQLLGLSKKTITDYIYNVAKLAHHYNKSPLLLTPPQVIDYLHYIRNVRKLEVRTYNIHYYSIKKFYEHFLPEKTF